ncbi:AzlD domain-containing protein [Halovulum dunhuangense]|uniref:AzlD domain-containing protein n=1 Tax=Halovulum dunhuangense TaxID=1505036 RepID=A0A849KVY4_9RHOB|nr:AzlD domain-containing protein [Halovulum dunhuangense]NNU79618.1 AzlD domain-containing protein [Halovulum dunhuangense]
MTAISDAKVWAVIILLGIGTYLIRFSFLGLIGDRRLPPLVLRLLRFTPVAVLPALVAPMVAWPAATGGELDPARILAAAAAAAIGIGTRSVLGAIAGGMAALYLGIFVLF